MGNVRVLVGRGVDDLWQDVIYEEGFPFPKEFLSQEWEQVILRPQGSFASAADFKAPERKKIADRGYTIVLSLGDQQSDLSGGFAERTFKLPNPVYFLP